jgi:hypothetical protein
MKTFHQFYEDVAQGRQNSAQRTQDSLIKQKQKSEARREQQQSETRARAAEAEKQRIEREKENRLAALEQKLNRQ